MNYSITALTLQRFIHSNLLSTSLYSKESKLFVSKANFNQGFFRTFLRNFNTFNVHNSNFIKLSQESLTLDTNYIRRQKVSLTKENFKNSIFDGCNININININMNKQDAIMNAYTITFKQCFISGKNGMIMMAPSSIFYFDRCAVYSGEIMLCKEAILNYTKTNDFNITGNVNLSYSNHSARSSNFGSSSSKSLVYYSVISSNKLSINNPIIESSSIQNIASQSSIRYSECTNILIWDCKASLTFDNTISIIHLYTNCKEEDDLITINSINEDYEIIYIDDNKCPSNIPTITPTHELTQIQYKVHRNKKIKLYKQ